MFRRSDCCHHCSRRHARRSFFRGIIAALLLIITAAALLHDHARSGRTQPGHTLSAKPRPSQARQHHPRPRRRHATAPASARPAAVGHPPATSHAATATAGQDLSWTAFHGIGLPGSASDGPHDTRADLASGFTDTPRGALLAAINIAVRTAAVWGPAIFKPTITRQVTGPDAVALLRAEEHAYAALRAAANGPGNPGGRVHAVEAAYRFVTCTPAAATVDVVTAGPGPSGTTALTATRITVLWRQGDWRVLAPPGGDWRVLAPPGGDWRNTATAISSLTGYVIFSRKR